MLASPFLCLATARLPGWPRQEPAPQAAPESSPAAPAGVGPAPGASHPMDASQMDASQAQEAEPSDLLVPLAARFEGALLDSECGQDFVETPGYRRLLEQVWRYTDEE